MYKFHHYGLQVLRSEEVVIGKKCLRPFFVHGYHGNTKIHMHTKVHLHAVYGVQV